MLSFRRTRWLRSAGLIALCGAECPLRDSACAQCAWTYHVASTLSASYIILGLIGVFFLLLGMGELFLWASIGRLKFTNPVRAFPPLYSIQTECTRSID